MLIGQTIQENKKASAQFIVQKLYLVRGVGLEPTGPGF